MATKVLGALALFLLVSYFAIRILHRPQAALAAEEQAVIVTIRLRSGDMGSAEERKQIIALENQLAAAIEKSGTGEYDGDEFGDGVCTIYAYGPSAEKLYSAIQPILKKFNPPVGSYVIKRCGKPGAKQDKISLDSSEASKPK